METKDRDCRRFRKGEVVVIVICAFCGKAEQTGYRIPPSDRPTLFLIPYDWEEVRERLWCGKCKRAEK